MGFWTIVLYTVCIITAITSLIALVAFIVAWVKGELGKETIVMILVCGLFSVFILIIGGTGVLWDEIKEIVKDGGIRKHRRKVREEKERRKQIEENARKREKERKRLLKLYKSGQIRRDELPRSENGKSRFEIYRNAFESSEFELIYVENEYNPVFNSFFQRHHPVALKRGIVVKYIPKVIEEVCQLEYIRYLCPSYNGDTIELLKEDSTYFLKFLCYPEDAAKLKPGLLYNPLAYNGCAIVDDYYAYYYYPLEEGDDESIMRQLHESAKHLFESTFGGLFYTIKPEKIPDEGSTDKYADLAFNTEMNKLVDEVRERVKQLEQLGISRKMLFNIIKEQPKLSRMVITKDYRIILPDYHDMEIKMEPLNKAVYLLFLSHPKGIRFKSLPSYRKELRKIYQAIKPNGMSERMLKSIDDVTNPCLNSINEKCARIRGAFISQFDDELASHYYILGSSGEPKSISLPRDMVMWENDKF